MFFNVLIFEKQYIYIIFIIKNKDNVLKYNGRLFFDVNINVIIY